MSFLGYIGCAIAGLFLWLICDSLPSIWTSIKTPFVVKNIKYISTVDYNSIVISLNKFLGKEFQITSSEDENVKFILKSFDDSVKRLFLNQDVCNLRQAFVDKESYFYLALNNFLLCYDERQEMRGKLLCIATGSNEYSITPFGITYYKMLAANSKKCSGQTSVYRVYDSNEWGNRIGKPHYVKYYTNDDAFEKLKTKTFSTQRFKRI